MLRKAAARALWFTKGAALFGGAVVTLALVLGVAAAASGANGSNFVLGSINNTATALTKLTANVQGPAMQVQNTNPGTDDSALSLSVQPGEAPMRVNSTGRVPNLNADKLDGKDFASSFDAQEVITGGGPLPKTGFYTSKGGTLIISASGSGFRNSGLARQAGRIGMQILVDGEVRGYSQATTNELNSHRAFVPAFLVVEGLPAGGHTIRIEALYSPFCNSDSELSFDYCTDMNNDDPVGVTVVEIPD